MKVLTSVVVDGRLDVPDGVLHNGETVTLVVHDDEVGFELTPEEESFLSESLAQIKRGEWVDGWQLLDQLKA